MGKILEKLQQKKVLVSDGAWGTLLHEKGLGSSECPESWNLKNPDAVYEVARSYVDAGADLILTNSFGGSPFKLAPYGLRENVQEINRAAAGISRRAAGTEVLVLGSMGPTGKMILMGEVTADEVLEGYTLQARGLVEGGVDGLLVETMSDLQEATLAVRAARNTTDLEVACTFTFERNADGMYRTIMGTGVEEAVEAALEQGADIVGANCGNGTAGMIDIVGEIRQRFRDVPVLIHANAGLPEYRDGKTVFPETPAEMAALMKELAGKGANIVGGCCGTTPAHISEIIRAIG